MLTDSPVSLPLAASSAHILNLSDDILTHVVAAIAIKEQLPLRGVCRTFRRVCDGDRLWVTLCASGHIAPARPLTWKGLGQRLACHKWCYGREAELTPTDDNRDDEDADEPLGSPEAVVARPSAAPLSAHRAPQGKWIKMVQSGVRYETFAANILPYMDLVAASKPLTNHKGNNTASIGLIPIDLYAPEMTVPADGVQSTESSAAPSREGSSYPSSTRGNNSFAMDPAVALHKKLFSAMGVDFTGNWDELCAVMRPRKVATSSPTQQVTGCTAPSISVFDTMPHVGARRVMALCLSPGDVDEHPNATAKLTETLLTTCSSVVFAAPNAESLSEWLRKVSPHMSLIASPSPFSTADNTPNIIFMTSTPIPSLREVLASSRGAATASVHTPTTPNAVFEPIASPPTNPTKEAFSWVLNRSSCVGEVVFEDNSCPMSIKTFYAPAWVAPECSLPLPAPTIARMVIAAGNADGGLGTTSTATLWTRDVVQSVCSGHSKQCTEFYEEAMRTEISDANKPLIAFTHLPVPMDPAEIVSIQDHFFYASLRSYAMSVRHVCGSDTQLGMGLLEEFKKDISTCFRKLWAENIAMSRAYCTLLFDNIFHPVHERYGGAAPGFEAAAGPSVLQCAASPISTRPDAFTDKRALHQWFSAVTDKISEYVIKAKGPRKMDVLSERITTRTVGGLKNYCLAHPNHPYLRIEDVALAGNEISAYCAKQLNNYHSEQDEVLSVKQRNSAMYTACMGTMWAAESVAEAVKYLSMLSPEYDTWGELLQLKREGFGLAPAAILSMNVGGGAEEYTSPASRHEKALNGSRGGDAPSSSGYVSDAASETNSVSAVSSSGDVRSSQASASRASSSRAPYQQQIAGDSSQSRQQQQPTSSSSNVKSLLSNFLSRRGKSANASSSPIRGADADLRRRARKGECVLFTELEVERQGYLQALMHMQSELKNRMEAVGKQFNLRSDQTSDFNVIQRQFSNGFKDYRTTRKMEEAADEIASRLRVMRERVRNSFASTRD